MLLLKSDRGNEGKGRKGIEEKYSSAKLLLIFSVGFLVYLTLTFIDRLIH